MLPIGTGPDGVRISTTGLEWDLGELPFGLQALPFMSSRLTSLTDGTQPSALGGLVSTSNHLADPQGRVGVTTDLPFCWTVELKTDAERGLD